MSTEPLTLPPELAALHIIPDAGGHTAHSKKACGMELASLYRRHVLHEQVVFSADMTDSPVIAAYVRSLWDSDPRHWQAIADRLDRIATSGASKQINAARAWVCTDWIVRTYAPAWLRLAGLADRADELLALPPLTSALLAEAAHPIIVKAKDEAARDARDARAARDAWAAWYAWVARDARVARDAQAAWVAWVAWDARDARVAWAAQAARVAWVAWDARDARVAWAARDAGRDCVLAVAYAAAKGMPTYDEARAAAEAALEATTNELDAGLIALLDAMLDVAEETP